MPYRWLTDPTTDTAAEELLGDVENIVRIEVYDVARTDFPKASQAEIEANPKIAARVELETGKRLANFTVLGDKGLRRWAIQSARSGLYRYHDQEFESPEDLFRAALEDITPGTSTWSDLNWIATQFYPLAMAYAIDGADRLWNDRLIEKTRMAVPLLRAATAERDATQEAIEAARSIVHDVIHLTGEKFEAKYRPKRSSIAPLTAYQYLEPKGGVLLIQYQTEAERRLVEDRLRSLLEVHFGDGTEAVLHRLVRPRVGVS